MIREGREFEDYIQTQLFLQRVYDLSDSLKLRHLYKVGTAFTSDVAFCHDTLWHLSDRRVSKIFKELRTPRVLISEVLRNRQIMDYTQIAAEAHYQLVRCRFIPGPVGDIAVMELIQEERDDQIPTDRGRR